MVSIAHSKDTTSQLVSIRDLQRWFQSLIAKIRHNTDVDNDDLISFYVSIAHSKDTTEGLIGIIAGRICQEVSIAHSKDTTKSGHQAN